LTPLRLADLIEDLEFHLIVYHPYRSLVHMTGRDSGPVAIRESMLEMEDNQLQVAWWGSVSFTGLTCWQSR
jgi:hypothetical protein